MTDMKTDNVTPLSVVSFPKQEANAEAADMIRQYADMVESGEILDVCLVGATSSGSVMSYVSFEDRLTILGALEHAKQEVGNR